ncbi:MAG TPA: glycoside hydrolase family 5 protein [Terriglobales bacterium]|nr:glycoside hydrolase family 5 protein [Terriglobales bacterium]
MKRKYEALAGPVLVVAGILAVGRPLLLAAAPGITVAGNQLVTTSAGRLGGQMVAAGVPVVLRGVNFSGSEYGCLQQNSFWDNPQGNQATINAMLTWHANVVRLPLNEDCWLGINGAPEKYSGSNYIKAMTTFVDLANASGLIVEVDLHWGAGGTGLPTDDSYPGLDEDHASSFWESVANTFKDNASVIFNLINEPYLGNSNPTADSWRCYLQGGCRTPQVGNLGAWKVVGTQSVVNTVRATGATNPIIIAGLEWSNQLNDWLRYMPADPEDKIIAGVHIYFDGLACEDTACWNRVFAPILAAGHPVIVDEMGYQGTCTSSYITRLMKWADAQTPRIGYWLWSWNPFGCVSGPSLITNGAGNPTSTYGSGFKAHLLSMQ